MLNQRVKTDRIYSNQPRNQQSISTLSEGSECSKAGNGIEKKQKRILLNNADDDMKYLLYIICIIVCVGCSPSDKRRIFLFRMVQKKKLCMTAFLPMPILLQETRNGKSF